MVDAWDGAPPVPDLVTIRLLGPLALARNGVVSPLGGSQQRTIIALLATARGRMLSADELVERAWGGAAPATAAAALRVHLARLRSLLDNGSANPLRHTGVGYVLDPAVVRTDVARLDHLVRRSRAPALQAAERLSMVEQALGLWSGEALRDVRDDDELRIEAGRLAELRLELQEDLVDLWLATGRHVDASTEAAVMVAQEPLRERRTRQLMTALYRSGRQADALVAYRHTRNVLRDEVGVDPSPETRQLEARVLRQEASLAPPAPATVAPLGWDACEAEVRHADRRGRPDHLVRSLVETRLASVGAAAGRLIRLTAVLGDLARVDVLAACTDEDERRITTLGGEARRSGLVAPDGPGGRWVVPQREIRDALVAGVEATGDLEAMHLQASRGIQATLPDTGPVQFAAAWHLILGRRPAAGADDGTADGVCRAVDACTAAGRPSLARALCERGLALTDLGPHTRADLLMRLVGAMSMQGDVQGADDAWCTGVAHARTLDDAERFALMVLRHDRESRSILSGGAIGELLEEALQKLGPRPSALRVRVAAALLMEVSVPGRSGDVRGLLHEVEVGAREVDDDESTLSAAYTRHVLLRATPLVEEREQVARRLDTVAQSGDSVWWRGLALVAHVYDDFTRGAHPRVVDRLEELHRCVEESGSDRLAWHHRLMRSSLARDLGAFDQAQRWSDEAMVTGSAAGLPDARGAAALQALLVAFHQGRMSTLLPMLLRFREDRPGHALVEACAALAHAEDLDEPQSRAAARVAADGLSSPRGPDELTLFVHALIGEAQLGWQDRSTDLGWDEVLAPYSGQFITFGQVTGTFGPVDRLLGWAAWRRGDARGALDLLEGAERASRTAGTTPWTMRCVSDRARVLQMAGETGRARDLALAHLARASSLGLGGCARVLSELR